MLVHCVDRSELSGLKDVLIEQATACAEKNEEAKNGPPTHLIKNLEVLYVEYQSAKENMDISRIPYLNKIQIVVFNYLFSVSNIFRDQKAKDSFFAINVLRQGKSVQGN